MSGNTPPQSSLPPDTLIVSTTITRAAELLQCSRVLQTAAEQRTAAEMARLMSDERGKAFLFAMVDEVFRSQDPQRQAERWRRLLKEFGLPQYPSLIDRALMATGVQATHVLPGVVMPLVARRMRKDSARVILDADAQSLLHYLHKRREAGFKVNLNLLGEAVLGEEEASRRLTSILECLLLPEVDYISVKISAIFSQINLVAWRCTLEEIKKRLRTLYRAALPLNKFINLDMEEYRDLALTVAAFQEVLDEPEFVQTSAGIALQAYLPDSWAVQQQLTAWAQVRVERGGAPVKIRLVKGANLAMEQVEAVQHGWNPAPYATKAETDANYRRMLEFGCRANNLKAVRLGVASHNLFDVALALTLREQSGMPEAVEIEMLEGMANHQARAVNEAAPGVLLYAPAVHRDDFLSALSYLVRRLDENTAPQNFLHDLFALTPHSPAWEKQVGAFTTGWEQRNEVSAVSRRLQPAFDAADAAHFRNQPDSDWTQAGVREQLEKAIGQWSPPPLPPLAALENLLQSARAAQPNWEAKGFEGRAAILERAASVMAGQRFTAIACMRSTAKKAVTEADAEVSEAIDFARYYARTVVPEGVAARAMGVVVVAPPWNFPYAIPAGGVMAALMAGNAVILKPAPEVQDVAYLLACQLWEAGVPRDVLQFFPCADGELGKNLICDERVAVVTLTGSIETARLFQSWRPTLPLFAETSGKNAIVITAQADRELAIRDLVKSAFGHAGQKCSAASLAIVEAEVYDSPDFRRQLRDAAASLPVGDAKDLRSVVTPSVQSHGEALKRALTTLDEGEEWLLEPRQPGDDACLWSPGIRLGVQPESWFHQTECFGPVLGLMRADSLQQAIDWQNAVAFGLTAGLHSLDPVEIALWREKVQAGNLYINKPITGAIVQRQPFGGWKASSTGPGAKGGGPNYVFNFCSLEEKGDETDFRISYRQAWDDYFSQNHDPSNLPSESNVLRYRPARGVVLRLKEEDETIIAKAEYASQLTGTPLHISLQTGESDEEFIERLAQPGIQAEFLRTVTTPPEEVLQAAYRAGLNWINAPLTSAGRIELRYWLREQAVSQTLHRYGQISSWRSPLREPLSR